MSAGPDLTGSVVVVTGAAGTAGPPVVARLRAAGASVVTAGRSTVDLLDETATRDWAAGVLAQHARVDGVVHLVGGWRGSRRFVDTDTADASWLHDHLVRTLQHVTLAFHDPLQRSPHGRFAMVSSTAATRPTAGNAAYAAAKAGAEAWTMAMADSFRRLQSGRKADPVPQRAAAVVLVVTALATEAPPGGHPDVAFAATAVADLADAVGALWQEDAEVLNGRRIILGT